MRLTPHDPRSTHFLFCIFYFFPPKPANPIMASKPSSSPCTSQTQYSSFNQFCVVGWKEGTPVHHTKNSTTTIVAKVHVFNIGTPFRVGVR